MRQQIAAFLDTPRVHTAILAVIVVNALVLGLQTSDTINDNDAGVLEAIDRLCLVIFIGEIALKIYASRLGFFRQSWNVFDLAVVGLSLGPVFGVNLSVLRALRVLRLLRVISFLPQLRVLIEAMVRSLPGLGSIILLLGLIFYVTAVMGTQLYGDTFPEYFGTLGRAAFSLFQIMTLEGWPDIARPVMEIHPNAWAFFVIYIMATNLCVLNLVVGLIVNSMESAHTASLQEKADAYQDEALATMREIRDRLDALERGEARLGNVERSAAGAGPG